MSNIIRATLMVANSLAGLAAFAWIVSEMGAIDSGPVCLQPLARTL